MKKVFKNSKAITLIALVITIIILLILAGVTISTLTGQNGLLANAAKAKEEQAYAVAEEKVTLAVNASYDNTGSLSKKLLKTNVNNIDGIEEEITTVEYPLNVKVDTYEFTITEVGSITCLGRTDGKVTLPENTPTTDAGTEVALDSKWSTKTVGYYRTSDGNEVTGLTEVATVYAVSDGNANTVPVPYGFYYVGGTVDSGVVISDSELDKNKYVGQTDIPNDLVGNQFVWIPCSLSDYTKISWGSQYENNTWDKSTNTSEETQIQKYGGFYIARYEAGTSNATFKTATDAAISTSSWNSSIYTTANASNSSKPTSKANEIPWFHADYSTSVTMAKRMYNTNYVTSGLATGTQFDAMLKWMSTETDNSDLKANCSWGNYNNTTLTDCNGKYCTVDGNGSSSAWADNTGKTNRVSTYTLLTTGASETAKKKNLYDVAGNLWEWTQECVSSADGGYYMLRGGSFGNAYASYPACYRAYGVATGTDTNFGFRVALYMK